MTDDIVTRTTKHIIDAEICPLEGKHYGTNITLRLADGKKVALNVWLPYGDPSDEELSEWGIDRAGWEANIEVDDMWDGKVPVQSVFFSDNHYQSQYELEVCQEIVRAVRGG